MPLSAYDYVVTEEESLTKPKPDTGKVFNPVPTGIYHVDQALTMGIEPDTQGIYQVQGGMGSRKTTFILNVIMNQLISGQLPSDHLIVWWSLETSMTVERIQLILRCMIASKILIYCRYVPGASLEALFTKNVPEIKEACTQGEYLAQANAIRDNVRALFLCNLPAFSPDQIILGVTEKTQTGERNILQFKHQ